MVTPNIPKATAKRLPIYYRYLNILADAGKRSEERRVGKECRI